jgi:broad specificity phosphatase PhoE
LSKLILVKHSKPEIRREVPSAKWTLSDEGRARCRPLAERLRTYSPTAVITSTEPKAIETGHIVATLLGLEINKEAGLHEHEREHVKVETLEIFHRRVEEFFSSPTELVFGSETADQAHERFSVALTNLLQSYSESTVVVTHGTVLSLFVGRKTGMAPLSLWRRLGLPSYVVLDRSSLQIIEIVDEITAPTK